MNKSVAAAWRLVDALTRENDALKRVDYAAAMALVPEKEAALAALTSCAATPDFPIELARRLQALTIENREQLERAIAVQTRVVQIVARACVPPAATNRYSSRPDRQKVPHRAVPLALSTRA